MSVKWTEWIPLYFLYEPLTEHQQIKLTFLSWQTRTSGSVIKS